MGEGNPLGIATMAKVVPMRKARTRGAAATLHDVARLASVSPITVSRALNEPERVSPGTLERVRAAISRTGYVPNLLAGGLRSAKSRLVAAVVPTIAGPVFLETIQSLTDALDRHGYQLLLGQSGYENSREDALIDAIVGRRPVGIVLTGMKHTPEGRRRLLGSRIPIVETWDLAPTPLDMAVGFNHDLIGDEVCAYLHGRGRKRPALVSADDERARRRAAGFARAAKRLGMASSRGEVPTAWIPAPATLANARKGLAEILAKHPKTDAVFCSSDLVALGALTEAHARGIDVPKDLAVAGFGDLEFSAGVIPSLTTVRVDGRRIGRTAAQFIIDRAEGRDVAEPVVDVGFSLIQRAST
jgi:LacI family gluconate utilization system Gnt-I transcriptional repressor